MAKEPTPLERALEDVNLMKAWGALNAYWDEIEKLLFYAFDALIADDGTVSRAIFYSQKSHAARRSMVEELAKQVLATEANELRDLANVIKRVKARSESRHSLAHGEWGELLWGDKSGELHRFPITTNIFQGIEDGHSKDKLEEVARAMKDTAEYMRGIIMPMIERKQAKRIEEWKRTARPEELAAYEAMITRLATEKDMAQPPALPDKSPQE